MSGIRSPRVTLGVNPVFSVAVRWKGSGRGRGEANGKPQKEKPQEKEKGGGGDVGVMETVLLFVTLELGAEGTPPPPLCCEKL